MSKLNHTLFLILAVSTLSSAQVGLSSQYLIQDIPNLEVPSFMGNQITSQFGIGLSYWFRLKKVRWEISPTLYYHQGSVKTDAEVIELSQQVFSIHIQNNFYLMDFKNDCMCPTFSKQGEWIRKGFFIYAAPGLGTNQYKTNQKELDRHLFGYGEAGFGIDFGLNNVLTLTPSIGYRQLFGSDEVEEIQSKASYNQLVTNLKLTFRWDKQNFYRRR